MSFNTLVDAHGVHNDEILWLKDKIVNLEERSRRNNIKIMGIPKMVSASQLPQYVYDLFTSLAPSLSAPELTVDRVRMQNTKTLFPGLRGSQGCPVKINAPRNSF